MKKFLSFVCFLSLSAALLAGCTLVSRDPSVSQEPSGPEGASVSQSVQMEAAEVNVMALNGPTSMGMVQFMTENDARTEKNGRYNFTITSMTDEVSAALAQGTTDIAAIPANLASILYHNTNGGVQVLAINTLGVLYITESGDTVRSVDDLRRKTIYASGKGNTPEYALNYVLSQNGIDPVRDVIIEPAECLAALTAQENSIAMLPQPFVTTAQSKSDRIRVALDLTEEWNKLQADSVDPSALVTGVVVARTAFVKEHPEAVSDFLDCCQTSVEYVNSNIDEAAKMMDSYGIVASEVAQKAIPSCNIVFIEGSEMKEKLSGYLSVLFEQNVKSVGGTLPDDDFYYKR